MENIKVINCNGQDWVFFVVPDHVSKEDAVRFKENLPEPLRYNSNIVSASLFKERPTALRTEQNFLSRRDEGKLGAIYAVWIFTLGLIAGYLLSIL